MKKFINRNLLITSLLAPILLTSATLKVYLSDKNDTRHISSTRNDNYNQNNKNYSQDSLLKKLIKQKYYYSNDILINLYKYKEYNKLFCYNINYQKKDKNIFKKKVLVANNSIKLQINKLNHIYNLIIKHKYNYQIYLVKNNLHIPKFTTKNSIHSKPKPFINDRTYKINKLNVNVNNVSSISEENIIGAKSIYKLASIVGKTTFENINLNNINFYSFSDYTNKLTNNSNDISNNYDSNLGGFIPGGGSSNPVIHYVIPGSNLLPSIESHKNYEIGKGIGISVDILAGFAILGILATVCIVNRKKGIKGINYTGIPATSPVRNNGNDTVYRKAINDGEKDVITQTDGLDSSTSDVTNPSNESVDGILDMRVDSRISGRKSIDTSNNSSPNKKHTYTSDAINPNNKSVDGVIINSESGADDKSSNNIFVRNAYEQEGPSLKVDQNTVNIGGFRAYSHMSTESLNSSLHTWKSDQQVDYRELRAAMTPRYQLWFKDEKNPIDYIDTEHETHITKQQITDITGKGIVKLKIYDEEIDKNLEPSLELIRKAMLRLIEITNNSLLKENALLHYSNEYVVPKDLDGTDLPTAGIGDDSGLSQKFISHILLTRYDIGTKSKINLVNIFKNVKTINNENVLYIGNDNVKAFAFIMNDALISFFTKLHELRRNDEDYDGLYKYFTEYLQSANQYFFKEGEHFDSASYMYYIRAEADIFSHYHVLNSILIDEMQYALKNGHDYENDSNVHLLLSVLKGESGWMNYTSGDFQSELVKLSSSRESVLYSEMIDVAQNTIKMSEMENMGDIYKDYYKITHELLEFNSRNNLVPGLKSQEFEEIVYRLQNIDKKISAYLRAYEEYNYAYTMVNSNPFTIEHSTDSSISSSPERSINDIGMTWSERGSSLERSISEESAYSFASSYGYGQPTQHFKKYDSFNPSTRTAAPNDIFTIDDVAHLRLIQTDIRYMLDI